MRSRVDILVILLKGKLVPQMLRTWRPPWIITGREVRRDKSLHQFGVWSEISFSSAIPGEIKRSSPDGTRVKPHGQMQICVCSLAFGSKHFVFSKQLASCASLIFFFFFKEKYTHKTACHCWLHREGRQALECFPVTSSLSWFSHEKETQSNKRCLWKVLLD